MDRKAREELNEMSKKVFGTTSKWQKLVNKGVAEPYQREREVMVPGANGNLLKKTFTDTKHVKKRYSVEEVRKLMQDELDERQKRVANKALDDLAQETEKLGLNES